MPATLRISGVTSDVATLIIEATEQGWTVEETKNGRLWWRPPNLAVNAVFSAKRLRGRELANVRARLRSAGLKGPQMVGPAQAVKDMHQPQIRKEVAAVQPPTGHAKRAQTMKVLGDARELSLDQDVYAAALRAVGSATELAERIGVHPTTLSHWKSGNRTIRSRAAVAAYSRLEDIALMEMTKTSEHPDHVALRQGATADAAAPAAPAAPTGEQLAPEAPSVVPAPSQESVDGTPEPEPEERLQEDIEAVTALIEELVRRRMRGLQERLARLDRELSEERARSADLRDENERLRVDRDKVREKAAELARKAAEEAIAKFLR